MIERPPALTLLASLTAHCGALALLFTLTSGEPQPLELVIDLREQETPAVEPKAAAVSRRAAAPPQRRVATRDLEPAATTPEEGPKRPAPEPVVAPPPAVTPPAPVPEAPPPPVAAPAVPPRPEPDTAAKPVEPRQPKPWAAALTREQAPDGVSRNSASTPAGEFRAGQGDPGAERADAGIGRRSTQEPSGTTGGGARMGVALAPAGPPGGEAGAEYGAYKALVRRRIQEALRYPAAARRQGIKGTVELQISINANGAIGAVTVSSSSSHRVLDEAALETVRNLAPQPFPAGLLPRALTVWLPVVFDLQ